MRADIHANQKSIEVCLNKFERDNSPEGFLVLKICVGGEGEFVLFFGEDQRQDLMNSLLSALSVWED